MRRMPNVVVISLAAVAIVATGCARRPLVMQAAAQPPAGQVEAKPSEAPAQPRQPSRAAQRSTSGGRMENARPAPSEFVDVADLKEIHFDFDKYDIRKPDAQILNGNAEWLKSHEDQLLLIEGHCDERGTNEYNLALGERRAKSTMDYLVSRGLRSNRISIVSYGEERPKHDNSREETRRLNRRAALTLRMQ